MIGSVLEADIIDMIRPTILECRRWGTVEKQYCDTGPALRSREDRVLEMH